MLNMGYIGRVCHGSNHKVTGKSNGFEFVGKGKGIRSLSRDKF